jgi:hypothetical protein
MAADCRNCRLVQLGSQCTVPIPRYRPLPGVCPATSSVPTWLVPYLRRSPGGCLDGSRLQKLQTCTAWASNALYHYLCTDLYQAYRAEACHDAQNHQSSTHCCDDWLGASYSAIGSHGGPTAAMTPRGIDQMREVLGRMYKRLMMHRFTNQALFAVMIGMELPTAQLAAMEGIVRFKSTRKEAR